MKRPTVCTRLGVFVGAAAFCVGVVFAQQPVTAQPAQSAAFQPAPAPLPLQQPVQAQPAQPAAYQPAPAPLSQPAVAQPIQPAAYQPAPAPLPQQQLAVPPPPPDQAVAPVAPVPPPVNTGGSAGVAAVPSTGIIDAGPSMRFGVELSAEALAAAPYLFYNKGRGPGIGRVMSPKDNGFYQRYDRVMVAPTWKEDPPFKAGDTVDVLRSMEKVKVGGQRARIVARVARGAVLGFAGKRVVIQLVDVWDKVIGSERIAKTTPFIPIYIDNKPADKGQVIKARVVARVDKTVSPYMHQYVVVDKGSEAGVKLGDFFKVIDAERPWRLAETLVEAQAVNVTAKSSTLVLQKVYKDRLAPRDEAYLSFRAAVK